MENSQHKEACHLNSIKRREYVYQLWGWILFVVCAIFFIISGIINGDIPAILGSVFFFVACFLFLIPLIKTNNSKRNK
ncbi:MAG: hypothetical protein PVI62_09630 [Desulfobacterales bacterium]|jgi:uncharacterized membrane protein